MMNSTSTRVSCPVCAKSDECYKVSTIYVEGSAFLHQHKNINELRTINSVLHQHFPNQIGQKESHRYISALMRLLKPPSGNQRFTRSIHPDGMVLFVLVIFVMMLWQTLMDQTSLWVGLVICGLLFGLFYLIFRKKIIERYEQSKLREQADIARIERAVSHWMGMYVCLMDGICFDQRTSEHFPIEELQNHLM